MIIQSYADFKIKRRLFFAISIVLIWNLSFLGLVTKAQAVEKNSIKKLTVINVSSEGKPSYAIYWPQNMGNIALERATDGQSFQTIVTLAQNFYLDQSVESGKYYSYRIQNEIASDVNELSGLPTISDIQIDSGTSTESESSLIVFFSTDKLAKVQVLYGESASYDKSTELDNNLNQSHTILLDKLVPGKSYHIKVRAIDKTGQLIAESADQTSQTDPAPASISLLEIIIKALGNAFSGLQDWINK